MSYHEYITAQALVQQDPPFYALVMAAMRKADSTNIERLRAAWPDVWAELDRRYNAPGGVLYGEVVSRSPDRSETEA